MSLFLFLTVVQALVAAALVGLVLIQKSEGGGLGVGGGGGGPGGLMSARGAADFLTRTTKWLAVVFVVLSIVMAAVAVKATSGDTVDDSLKRTAVPAGAGAQPAPAPAAPGAAPTTAPAPARPADNDPLKNVAQ